MGDEPSADAEPPSEPDNPQEKHLQHLINVSETGDIILAVTFLTSPTTLERARRAALRKVPGQTSNESPSSSPTVVLAPSLTLPYRVSLASLTKHSLYFRNLLTNPSFREAQLVYSTHAALTARGTLPSEANPLHLPWVSITDDDDATQSAARQEPLEDMLRIMHDLPIATFRVVMSYVTTLAIIADRFDATGVVARALAQLKFKWPLTSTRPYVDQAGRTTDVEALLRQKILLAWLLNQPMRLHRESRELIIRGSRIWGAYPDQDTNLSAAWWNLPEGIEGE